MSVEPDDLKIETNEHVLKVRVTGVLFDEQGRLLVGGDNEGYALIGGKQKFNEFSDEAIQREFIEETGMNIEPVRLLANIENIFVSDKKRWQEIGFMYLVKAPAIELDTNAAMATDQTLTWLPATQWGKLLPHGVDKIIRELPATPVHLRVRDGKSY